MWKFIKWFLGILFVLYVIGSLMDKSNKNTKSTPTSSVSAPSIPPQKTEVTKKPEESEKPKTSADYLKEAKRLLAMKSPDQPHGDIWGANMQLVYIEKGAKEYAEAQQLLNKIKKWKADSYKAAQAAQQEKYKSLSPERMIYAPILEIAFLEKGYDVSVNVTGKDATTLTMKCILFSRPRVYNLTKDGKLFETWRDMGFRKVVFTDGWQRYEYKLN